MNEKNKYFSDYDRKLLEAASKSTWVPPDPINLILPYFPDEEEKDEPDLEKRLRKSREVLEGYQRLEAKCDELLEDLSERCAKISIAIDPKKNRRVLEAARRLFGRDVREITFQMYTDLVHRMTQADNNLIPESAKGRRLI